VSTPKSPIEAETAEALLGWLEAFPNKELERRLSLLLTQRRKLDVEIRFIQTQLMRHRQYLEDLSPGSTTAIAEAIPRTSARSRSQYPPKRMAVLRFLSETPGRAWRLADLKTGLIGRGWLEDNDRARHALQVTVLGMAKRGELEKPRTGYYSLATDRSASGATGTDDETRPS
jgi:hypothetical protein